MQGSDFVRGEKKGVDDLENYWMLIGQCLQEI